MKSKRCLHIPTGVLIISFFVSFLFSSCEFLNSLKSDIEKDVEQAKTEAYFRLYGLFDDTEIAGNIDGWDCAQINLIGTKGYFIGKDSYGTDLIKGNYFYMEKPSSGEFYKEEDNFGSYTDDYQLPDDFDEGEIWLNVKYINNDGKWELFTRDSRDGSFYMANLDIPRGDDTFENAVKKTKEDYDRRKADAHDYATHKFHYALEYYAEENKNGIYEITEETFNTIKNYTK